MGNAEPYSLWIEWISRVLRLDRISAYLFGDKLYAPYLFVLTIAFIDVPVLSTISFLVHDGETVHPLLDNPWWFLVPLGLVVGVVGVRRIRSKLDHAVENAGQSGVKIHVSTPNRFQFGLFAVSVVLYCILIAPDLPQVFLSEGKIIGTVKWLVIIPLVYIAIIVELFSVYLHAILFFPLAINRRNVPLDFSDPKRAGGMEPVGSLLFTANNFYFLGLTLWTGTTVLGPLVKSGGAIQSNPGVESITFFIIAWVTGILLFCFSVYSVGKNTRKRKEAEICRTIREIQWCRHNPTTFTENSFGAEGRTAKRIRLYLYLDWIAQTEEYPIDVGKILTLFGTVVFPVLLKLLPFAV